MRTPRRTTRALIAAALTLGVVAALTGCSTSSPVGPAPTKAATTPTPTAPPTTSAPAAGTVVVAGFRPARVGAAAEFAEELAKAAMSGCGAASVEGLQHLMTPSLYKAALKNPKSWTVLTVEPPLVLSDGCVSSQDLSDASTSPGQVVDGMPSVRVTVTVTEGLMVGTTTSPKTLKPFTVARRFAVDVLPSGTNWLAHKITTSLPNLKPGK